jgi:hypothetical protein
VLGDRLGRKRLLVMAVRPAVRLRNGGESAAIR